MMGQTFFCWVRVIPATLEGSAYEVDNRSKHLEMLNGPKRPKRTVVITDEKKGGAVWFDGDKVHYGNPKSDVVFDFGPAYIDRSLAVEWLDTKGQKWAKEADNFFLLKIEQEASGTPETKSMAVDTNTGVGEYPKEQWGEEYQNVDQLPPCKWLFDPDAVELTTKPGYALGECVELLALERDQRPLWRDKIVGQAQGDNRAIQPVLDVVGIEYATHAKQAAFIDLVMTNVRCVLFRFKVAYARARPHHKCKSIGPMFMPTDHPLHPSHGSFPGGHAAFAFFWANFLGRWTLDQAQRQRMLEEAWTVARNRERAGLHFSSDTEAGKELGEKIAAAIFDNKAAMSEFESMLRR
jgi:hypothetical protein